MTCPTTAPGPLRCPTLDESIAATLALLPQGRAWPAHDLGMYDGFKGWLASLTATPAPGDWPAGYVQTGFFSAVGAVRNYLETRLCDLRMEFWCATHKETHPEWLAEYGLPDDCEPFPDLCTKVAALGGARCDYFRQITAALGWSIECVDWVEGCGDLMGCGFAGNAIVGAGRANYIEIDVTLADSTAYTGGVQTPSQAGLMFSGQMMTCPPDIGGLQCLMDRIAPAHVTIAYRTI